MLLIVFCLGMYSVFIRIANKVRQRWRTVKLLAKLPHLRATLPLVGDFLPVMLDRRVLSGTSDLSYMVLHGLCALPLVFHEGIISLWLTIKPFVVIFKAETVQAVFNSNWQLSKSEEYKLLVPWLGTGLLTSTGNKWQQRRKMLTFSFHLKILEDFIPIFNEQARLFVAKLGTQTAKEWFDIQPLAKMCSLDIICESVMGTKLQAQQDGNMDYVNAISELGDLVANRVLRPWLWPDIIFFHTDRGIRYNKALHTLHTFTRKVIKDRKSEMIKKLQESRTTIEDPPVSVVKRRRAFLDMLLTIHLEENTLSEEDVREEVDTFMFEGHDTTAAGISWALYLIGLYPDVQKRLHEEIDEIFGDDRQRPVTVEDLKQMNYLDRVLKESQRLYPSVPLIMRELEDDIMIKEYKIPKGVTLMIFITVLHRDPKVFPNPDMFDPDRFLPENSADRHPFAYVPFSAGPRNCIGQKFAVLEEKIVVTHVLRNFQVTSLDHRDKLEVTMEFITKERRHLRLKLSDRPRMC